jgi:hypothetical protein
LPDVAQVKTLNGYLCNGIECPLSIGPHSFLAPRTSETGHPAIFDAGPAFYFATLAFALVGLLWLRKYRANRSHLPLPPGPPSLPIVGSIFSFDDPTRPWQNFDAWKSTYGGHDLVFGCNLVRSNSSCHSPGDIIYARLFNTPVIVVNSEEVAKDLFEFRSAIYSDKSQSIVYKQ